MAWWRKSNEHTAIIDISSAAASGALMDSEREILSAKREPSAFLLDVSFDAFWRVTKKAFAKVVQHLTETRIRPDRVMIIFSSPWFIAETRGVTITKQKPWEVTEKILSELLAHEKRRFLSERSNHIKPLKGKAFLTEHLFLKTDLNGYFTRSAEGKETRTLEADIYMSMCVKKVISNIRDMLGSTWGDVELEFHTFPYIALLTLREIVNTDEGFTLIDMRGEITDILVMKNHTLESLASFTVGTNLASRRLASMDKSTAKESQSVIKAYFSKHLSKRESERIKKVLALVRDEWCLKLRETISNMESGPLPQNFFVLSDDKLRKYITSCVTDDSFASYTTLGLAPTIQSVNTKSLQHFFTFAGGTKRDADTPLLIETLYASRH